MCRGGGGDAPRNADRGVESSADCDRVRALDFVAAGAAAAAAAVAVAVAAAAAGGGGTAAAAVAEAGPGLLLLLRLPAAGSRDAAAGEAMGETTAVTLRCNASAISGPIMPDWDIRAALSAKILEGEYRFAVGGCGGCGMAWL